MRVRFVKEERTRRHLSYPRLLCAPQICSGAVQRPLLAHMRPCNAGPTLLSARSLCGAHPNVQLHQEHALNSSTGSNCWDVIGRLAQSELGCPAQTDPRFHQGRCGRGTRVLPSHLQTPPCGVSQTTLTDYKFPINLSIRCQESILAFWKIKGHFIKGK